MEREETKSAHRIDLPPGLESTDEIRQAVRIILGLMGANSEKVSIAELGVEFNRCYGIGLKEAFHRIGAKQKTSAVLKVAGFKIVKQNGEICLLVA